MYRSRAPLRISFAGGGTDVPPFPVNEGGAVLSATIDRYAHASLTPRADNAVSIHSVDFGLTVRLESADELQAEGELDLVRGAIKRFEWGRGGYDLLLESGAPPGSGLGSSSTVMTALVRLLASFHKISMTEYDLARLAWQIERIDLGVVGGKQDHYAAAFGGFNYIEFDADDVLVNPLRVPGAVIDELQHNLLLAYTGITRASAEIIEDQTARVTSAEPSVIDALRAQKALALEMKRHLLKGNVDSFGELLDEAWKQKRLMSPKIVNHAIDEVHDIAMRNGALGGKVTGAGGGGYILLYCPYQVTHRVASAIKDAGYGVERFAFTAEGARSWQTS